jgi:hypothetical protein
MHYFLPTKRGIKDTFISSENAPKLTNSNLGAKKFSAGKPPNPNKRKGKRRGGSAEGGVGIGVRKIRVGKVKCFSP